MSDSATPWATGCQVSLPFSTISRGLLKLMSIESVMPSNRLILCHCLLQRFIKLWRRWWPQPSQRKRNARRQSSCLRRTYKWLRKEEKQRRKWKIYPTACRVPENSGVIESLLKWTLVYFHFNNCLYIETGTFWSKDSEKLCLIHFIRQLIGDIDYL